MTFAAAGNRRELDFGDPVTEVFEFLHSIYGRRLPRLTFIISRKRVTDARGKVRITAEFYRRARPTAALIRKLLELGEKPGHEVFFRVAPMGRDGLDTTKEDALPINVAWTEVDSHGLTSEDMAFLRSVNATVVESGGIADDGGAKTHVYVPLSATHQPDEIEGLSRALRDRLSGDKFDVTTFLRLPGSWHRKDPDNPVRVSVRRYSTAARAKLPDVVSALGTDVESIAAQSRTRSASIEPVEPPRNTLVWGRGRKIAREVDSQIREATEYRGETIDRSDRLWGLYCELAKVGVLEGGHILWAAQFSKALGDRATGKDVARFLASPKYEEIRAEWESTQKPEPAVSALAEPVVDEPEPMAEPVKDGEFWEARPYLAHIRDFARARLVSPWAVLGVVLARVASWVPPTVTLPPTVGTKASLNLFIAIADDSGIGKGTAIGTARDCIETKYTLQAINLGSGEGIGHQYMERVNGELHQHTEAVMFMVNEIDSLTAMQGRSASTVTPTLCSAWVGEPLGFAYVDKNKRLPMAEHTYRLTLVCGVQPKRARSLIDAAGSGLPQRFLWLPALDLSAPEFSDDMAEPEPIRWALPAGELEHALNNQGHYSVPIADSIRRQIRKDRSNRMRGLVHVDELDSHRNLSRLKAATALAFLDGRSAVSEEDWALSDVLMAVSDATRGRVVDTLKSLSVEEARSRGKLKGAEQIAASEEVHKVNQAEDWAWSKIKAEGSVSEGELRRRCPSRFKDYLPEALTRLERDSKAKREQGKRKDSVSWVKF
ncbi:DUF3987 domain-containing protein [Streptomyces sp. NPDC002405]